MARIAVIGAGMGALAAAARLATGGHRVTVYERSATYGGGVGRYERDGFVFDTGPGLLHLPAVYRDLFIKTGKEPLEACISLRQVDPAIRHVFDDGTSVALPNASRAGVIAALDDALGAGAGTRWADLLGRAREVWEATRRPLLEDALAADTAPLDRDPYPAPPVRRGLFRRGAPTLAEVAARELADPRLAAMLEHYAVAYGFDPAVAPASATVLPYMEHTFGTWYVDGGMRALADAVYERCVARGVDFRFGAEVEEVVEKDGRAAGLLLSDGARVEADVVVAGAPVPALHREQVVPWDYQDEWPVWGSAGARRVVVCLALRGSRPAEAVHRTVVHGSAPAGGRDVVVLRPDDPATRPDDGHEAVTLQVPLGSADPEDALLAAEAAVPGLRGRLLWHHALAPTDAIPGPALAGAAGAFLRTANQAALPGLYFVGGWAHPGGGLAHTGMSGAIVSDLIAGGPGGSR
ncbi:phytoene desaturase family protein [Streptomyces sp. NPDC059373]